MRDYKACHPCWGGYDEESYPADDAEQSDFDLTSLSGLPLKSLSRNNNPITDFGPRKDNYQSLVENDFELFSDDAVSDEPIAIADAQFETALRNCGIWETMFWPNPLCPAG